MGARRPARPVPSRPAADRCLAAGLVAPPPSQACGHRADGRLSGPPSAWAAGRGSGGRPALGARPPGGEAGGGRSLRGCGCSEAPVAASFPSRPILSSGSGLQVASSGRSSLEWLLHFAFSFF